MKQTVTFIRTESLVLEFEVHQPMLASTFSRLMNEIGTREGMVVAREQLPWIATMAEPGFQIPATSVPAEDKPIARATQVGIVIGKQWSPARLAKFQTTMAAKRARKVKAKLPKVSFRKGKRIVRRGSK